jgi:hypothetical protein
MRHGNGISGYYRRLPVSSRALPQQPLPEENASESGENAWTLVLCLLGMLVLGVLSGMLGLLVKMVLRNWI